MCVSPDPEVDMVFGCCDDFVSPEFEGRLSVGNRQMNNRPALLAGTGLFRKGCFDRVGMLNSGQTLGPFVDWCARAAEMGLKFLNHPDVVLKRRLHPHSLTMLKKHEKDHYLKVIKAQLDRKRQAQAPFS